MDLLPSKCLQVVIRDISVFAIWEEPNTDWIGFPYQWTVTVNVLPQEHSSIHTQTPNVYTGMDIDVGDWVASGVGGFALQITQIISQTSDIVVAVAEDIDRYNTLSDSTGNGVGQIQPGEGYVFVLDEAGVPLLTPLQPGWLPPSFQTDMMSRFAYRNIKQDHIRVFQPGNTFVAGDIIRLEQMLFDTYELAPADVNVSTTTGIVQDVGIPGAGWFTFRPFGKVVENIPTLLTGLPGTLFYIDPTNPGKITSTKPANFARPVYMRLNSNNRAILLENSSSSSGSSEAVREQMYKPSNFQTRFVISDLAVNTVLTIAVNGIEDNNFIFDKTTRTVTIDTSSTGIGYSLDTNDEVMITYTTL